MCKSIDRGGWGAEADGLFAEIEAWRAEHAAATFDEIEDAIEERVQRLRNRLLTDTVQTSPRTEFGGSADRPVCPSCGGALQAKGRARRQLLTHQGGTVELDRTYGYCPRCTAGFFPPGSRT